MLAVASLVLAAPAYADIPTTPQAAVRSLHQVQDAIAAGDGPAFQMQADLLAIIDTLLGGMDGPALEQAEQRRALLTYAVTGGNPSTLIRVRDAFPDIDFGDQTELAQLVTTVVLRRPIPEDKVGQVMLSSGMLGGGLALLSAINADEPATAVRFLNAAILDAPGTLIEESALRRLMSLHLQGDERHAFLSAASRYARAFIGSPYASDFAATLVTGGTRMDDRTQFETLASIFDFMPDMHRKAIVARQMRAATIAGNFALVRFLGERFAAQVDAVSVRMSAADPGSNVDLLRQRLFFVMSNVATLDQAAVAAELAAIDPAGLPAADRRLLAAAKQVVDEITRPAGAPAAQGGDVSAPNPPVPDQSASSQRAPTQGGVRVVLPAAGYQAPDRAAEPLVPAPERMAPARPVAPSAASNPVQAAMPTDELDGFISSTRGVLDSIDALLSEQRQ